MKISNEMVEVAYEVGKAVYEGNISRAEAKFVINKRVGMKIGSANDYVTVFLDMMSGNEYHRTINNYATEFYLDHIREDYGESFFVKAVSATDKHTKYYATLGKGNLRGVEKIVKKYMQ